MKPNIILVHGILNQGRMFWKMAQHLAKCGFQVYAPDLKPNTAITSLTLLSEQLSRYIQNNLSTNSSYHLLGFSMGGLISRHYLQTYADIHRVQSFTTLSSPHKGTLNAWLLPLKGWKEMRPNSLFLQQLSANDHRIASYLRPLSLWTPFDLVILPANSSIWDIATNESFHIPIHTSMLYSKKVVARLVQHLGKENTSSFPR